MFRTLLALAVMPALSVGVAAGQEKAKKKAPEKKPVETFTDPEKARPDFKIQGEYEGTIAPPCGTAAGWWRATC